jgi:hypothetical protein
MIDSLLHGRILDDWNLWDVASLLRLPSSGPFMVIAAEVPTVGAEALPEVESKLHSLDVYSAWRLFPDVEVGIVHVKTNLPTTSGRSCSKRFGRGRTMMLRWVPPPKL